MTYYDGNGYKKLAAGGEKEENLDNLKNAPIITTPIMVVTRDSFLIQLLTADLLNKLRITFDYTQQLSDIYQPRLDKPVIILDLDSFDQASINDFWSHFKHTNLNYPFLMLSAVIDGETKYPRDGVKWLRKPFRLQQLVEDLQLLLQNNEWKPVETAFYLFDPLHQYIFCKKNNKKIYLTEKEIAILKALHRQPEGLNRSDLLKEIWGYAKNIETRTVESHIYRLRQKLKKDFPLHVVTDAISRKYKLICEP